MSRGEGEKGRTVLVDQDGWYYAEWRAEDEPSRIRYIRQRGPLCSGTEFEREVAVAGISREPFRTNAERFCRGSYRWLDIERQPIPDYPHAIAVFGRWWEEGTERRAQIGWVPDRLAKRVQKMIPQGTLRGRLYMVFLPDGQRGPGVRFDLLHSKRADKQP